MISLSALFWMVVILFALMGAMRGWAKELLVTCAVIVAIFLVTIIGAALPNLRNNLTAEASFWVNMSIFTVFVLLGYQSQKFSRRINNRKFGRDRFGAMLMGSFFGSFNGYMTFGTAWYYLNQAGYPFPWISPPEAHTEAGQNAMELIEILPPQWLQPPVIYLAVAVALVLILVVLI